MKKVVTIDYDLYHKELFDARMDGENTIRDSGIKKAFENSNIAKELESIDKWQSTTISSDSYPAIFKIIKEIYQITMERPAKSHFRLNRAEDGALIISTHRYE